MIFLFLKVFVIHHHVLTVARVFLILNIPIVTVLHLGMVYFVIFVSEKNVFDISSISFLFVLEYFHIMLASNLSFSPDYYFDTLNSPTYANLSSDIFAWLNNAFSTLPANKIYSINFVA